MRGLGRALFVAILLLIAGTLNVIYGIGAVSNAHFFDNTVFVFSSLHTWGWITIIVGVIQLIAGFSLAGGGAFGRVIGIIAASYWRARGAAVGRRKASVLVAGDLRALRDHRARPRRLRRGPAVASLA
jgi:hypothetical protein